MRTGEGEYRAYSSVRVTVSRNSERDPGNQLSPVHKAHQYAERDGGQHQWHSQLSAVQQLPKKIPVMPQDRQQHQNKDRCDDQVGNVFGIGDTQSQPPQFELQPGTSEVHEHQHEDYRDQFAYGDAN
jgi:hypothetical protein